MNTQNQIKYLRALETTMKAANEGLWRVVGQQALDYKEAVNYTQAVSDAAEMLEHLEYLREEEGASVEIYCDNPEYDGPNVKVALTGSATNWSEREFGGDNMVAALRAATAWLRDHKAVV